MDWHWPLIVVSALFVGVMVWRIRPVLPPARKMDRDALHAAKQKIEEARTDSERAEALCAAAEASASARRATSAEGYFLRAMRAEPQSVAIVDRAAVAMQRYPRALEALLWRRLGAEAWTEPNRSATMVALWRLKQLYEGPRRKRVQARALEFAWDALKERDEHRLLAAAASVASTPVAPSLPSAD